MYRFQDEVVAEEPAPCDPAIEDCPLIEEPPVEPEPVEEESSSMSPFILAFGLSPVLDLAAGYWNYDTWNAVDTWDTTYLVELLGGSLCLITWGTAVLAKIPVMETVFNYFSKGHILAEAVMLYLVYDANDTAPADG